MRCTGSHLRSNAQLCRCLPTLLRDLVVTDFLDKAKFYLNARGSLYELKSHLLIAKDLRFIADAEAANVVQIIEELSLQINNSHQCYQEIEEQGD